MGKRNAAALQDGIGDPREATGAAGKTNHKKNEESSLYEDLMEEIVSDLKLSSSGQEVLTPLSIKVGEDYHRQPRTF